MRALGWRNLCGESSRPSPAWRTRRRRAPLCALSTSAAVLRGHALTTRDRDSGCAVSPVRVANGRRCSALQLLFEDALELLGRDVRRLGLRVDGQQQPLVRGLEDVDHAVAAALAPPCIAVRQTDLVDDGLHRLHAVARVTPASSWSRTGCRSARRCRYFRARCLSCRRKAPE